MPQTPLGRAVAGGFAAALAFVAPISAAQTIYKWVDEKGGLHYSQEPPPDGKGGKVPITPASPSDKPPLVDNWRERETEFRVRQGERDRQFARDKAEAEKAATERRRLCGMARSQIEINRDHIFGVSRLNEKGEQVFLSLADRAREVERWQKVAKENC